MYAAVVEPWLGRYENLKEAYKRYQRGEDREKLVAELRQHGGDRRSEKVQNQDRIPILKSRGKDYDIARLHRDHPALYEAVRRGELSANAAAIEAGFRKKFTKFEQIVKWLPSLTPAERRQLRDLLKRPAERVRTLDAGLAQTRWGRAAQGNIISSQNKGNQPAVSDQRSYAACQLDNHDRRLTTS